MYGHIHIPSTRLERAVNSLLCRVVKLLGNKGGYYVSRP